MRTGERIKLLRVLHGYNQTYIANLVGTTQRCITGMESARTAPRAAVLNLISDVFGCSREWLDSGEPPAFKQFWGYAEIPPERIVKLERPTLSRKLNELHDLLQTLFVDFLRENKVSEVFVVNDPNGIRKLFLFPLALPVTFILKSSIEFWDSVEYVIAELELNRKGVVSLDTRILDCINDPMSQRTIPADVAGLYETLGVGDRKLAEEWALLSEKGSIRDARRKALYKKKVNEACRMIIENNIDPFDILACLKRYSDTEKDFDYLEAWQKRFTKNEGG